MVGEARAANGESGPLDGIQVLDASRVLAGPFCTMQLGDLGAEVVKVEHPDRGDQTRHWTPPTYGDSNESAYYLSVNRNKQSIALDFSMESARDAFRDLASKADVVVENFRPGKMEEWGLGYETLQQGNPDLVYCSLTGYGEWGPKKDHPAYDIMMQAEGGMMSITGEESGNPVRVGVAVADLSAGMYATQAILAALLHREIGDKSGQKIDISLFDGQVAWMSYMASYYFATGDPPGRMGSRHPTIVPYQAFPTQDGHIVVAVGSENLWAKFCRAVDRDDLRDDSRFATNEKRVRNREELEEMLTAEIQQYTTAEIAAQFEEYGVPASPVRNMEDVFASDQVDARDMHWTVDHPNAGTVEMAGNPMHFSQTPTRLDRHPPQLGEHTVSVLREAGLSEREIAAIVGDSD